MSTRVTAPTAMIRLHTPESPERLGGEARPYAYPHLYQIQAGDWRISYAVERNRLAILVLEVLGADGSVAPDSVRDSLTRKMKVKLLDWPEGSPSRDLPPEELGKKIRIRLLDLSEDSEPDQADAVDHARVRLGRRKDQRLRPGIRLRDLEGASMPSRDQATAAEPFDTTERKITPLDSPTM